jgi:hypothetical protein
MPIIAVFAVGAVAGFFVGRGTEGLGNLVKWGVIGTGGYVAAKHLKVI